MITPSFVAELTVSSRHGNPIDGQRMIARGFEIIVETAEHAAAVMAGSG